MENLTSTPFAIRESGSAFKSQYVFSAGPSPSPFAASAVAGVAGVPSLVTALPGFAAAVLDLALALAALGGGCLLDERAFLAAGPGSTSGSASGSGSSSGSSSGSGAASLGSSLAGSAGSD